MQTSLQLVPHMYVLSANMWLPSVLSTFGQAGIFIMECTYMGIGSQTCAHLQSMNVAKDSA